jgi:hypothetical protein
MNRFLSSLPTLMLRSQKNKQAILSYSSFSRAFNGIVRLLTA